MLNGYDIIGDIHGCAFKLESLLRRLGYEKIGSAWRHPERMVIFLGDYIDRGTQIAETLAIVRSMQEAGSAECLMGNHEFNAVCWNTPDHSLPGEYLRRHNAAHIAQHAATLEQLAGCYQPWVEWMRTLPLWMEIGDLGGNGGRLHMIHACWSPGDMKILTEPQSAEHMTTGRNDAPRLTESGFVRASSKGTKEYQAVETLLKGAEIPLPEGTSFYDKEGLERKCIRVKWWLGMQPTCRDMAFAGEDTISSIPEDALPTPGAWEAIAPEYPTFIGHYWMSPSEQVQLKSPNIACLDFSAVCGGPLVAYRWNRGDTCLKNENFVTSGTADEESSGSAHLFFP